MDRCGHSFSEDIIDKVWEKDEIVSGYDSNIRRKDKCSAWITKSQYGNRDSNFGWEIDHIIPKTKGGRDELQNYQPLQWKNNLDKSDGTVNCCVQSSGEINVDLC